MEQMKNRLGLRAIACIQGLDALAHPAQQVRVIRLRRLGRISKVGQQREQQIRIAIPQISKL